MINKRTDYDAIAERIVKKLDLKNVTDYTSFKQEILKAGRTNKPLLNFFGRSKDGGSGTEKLFESPSIQSRIKLKGSINEDKQRKQYKYINKEVKHKDIKHQKGKIKAVKRHNAPSFDYMDGL